MKRPYLLREPGEPQAEPSLRSGIALSLLICLATRVLVWTAAYTGAVMHVRIVAGVEPPLTWHTREVRDALADERSKLSRAMQARLHELRPLMNWDAGHYHSVVESGYSYRKPKPGMSAAERQANIAFFPLYPLVCAPLARLVGTWTSLGLVANLATLLSAPLVYVWMRRRAGHGAALCAVAVTFLWPTACFYSFGYPESLTLLLVAGALLAADRGAWPAAALAGGLATAARPTAVCLAPLLAWAHLSREREAGRANLRRAAAAVAIALVALGGALAYAGYLGWRFGSPLVYVDNLRDGWLEGSGRGEWRAWLTGEHVWDQLGRPLRALRELPAGLVHLVNPMTWNMPLSVAILALSAAAWRRVPPDWRPLLLLGPLIFAQRYLAAGWSGFALESSARYLVIALPTLAALGAWLWREASAGVRIVTLVGLALLQAAWALTFGMGEWAG